MRYPKRSQYKYAKSPYRIRNWPEYEAGLRRRGDLTIWLSETVKSIPGGNRPAESPVASAPTRTWPSRQC